MVLEPGSTFGRYRIIDRLGAGGMASVYHAFQAVPQRSVALKVISAELVALPSVRARFRLEANALAHLEHPNILPIYETGEAEGQPYICYRYVQGGTLKELLSGPLPVAETAAYLAPVADALDFAHERGVIHRDVKPANILLTQPDRQGRRIPIVADFGIARLLETALLGPDGTELAGLDTGPLTVAGVGLGTPAYMAPEQVLGRPLDGRADQYALAITAYQMLTGTVPFSATTPAELAFMQVHEPLPLPRSRNPGLSEAVEQVLLRGLSKHPPDRYPSCEAFVAALAAAGTAPAEQEREPVSIPAPEPQAVDPWAEAVPGFIPVPGARRAEANQGAARVPERRLPPVSPSVPPSQDADTVPVRQQAPRPSPRSRPVGRLLAPVAAVIGVAALAGVAAVFLVSSAGSKSAKSSPTRVAVVVATSAATSGRPSTGSGAGSTGTAVQSGSGGVSVGSATAATAAPSPPARTAAPATASPSPAPSPAADRAYLGLGLSSRDTAGSGALVDSVVAGGPADKAGVKAGDLLTAIDSTAVFSAADVAQALNARKAGDTVTLAINRSGTKLNPRATLGSAPSCSAFGSLFGSATCTPTAGQ